MGVRVSLQTAAWYGDQPLPLEFPDRWDVTVFWPRTPPRLTDDQLLEAFEKPVGQPPIREMARGKRHPLVIVDDLTRPTPAARIMPILLRQLQQGGIEADQVTILMATGAHRVVAPDALARKVGPQAAACRLLVHDYRRNLVRAGRTSFGSPVLVDREVMASDLVVGVGGIYPQHSTGFGGGSKLALGVLGKRSIVSLHYGHPSMAGSYQIDNDFRRDLDEIARLIRLHTMVSVHLDAHREVVRVVTGDHHAYYRDAVAFSREAYLAPLPGEADVIVSNAYPIDVSLTFMRSKGMTPLFHAGLRASRILVSACSEGIGYHGLFPFLNGPRFESQIHLWRRLSVIRPSTVPGKAARRVVRRLRSLRPFPRSSPGRPTPPPVAVQRRNPIWLYAPGRDPARFPSAIPGMTPAFQWNDLLDRVQAEQGRRPGVKVVVYPCAPLQVLDLAAARGRQPAPEELAISD